MQTGTNNQGREDYQEKPEQSSQQGAPMGNENYRGQQTKQEHHVQSDETQYGKIRESEIGSGKTEQRSANLREQVNEGARTMGERTRESSDKVGDKVNDWTDKTKNKINEWADKAEDKMNNLKDKVGEKMDAWTGKNHSERAEDKYEKAEKKMDKAEKKLDKAQDKFAQGYENDGARKMEKAEKKMDKADDKIRDAHEELRKTTDTFSSKDKPSGKENTTGQGTIR